MPDREKVINGLMFCSDIEHYAQNCGKCPYKSKLTDFMCFQLLRDALALLKEQDELLRKLQKDKDKLCLEVSEWKHKYHDRPLQEQEAVEPYQFEDIGKCGHCGDGVVAYEELGVSGIEEVKFNYCPTCGRRVLWEGR